MEWNEQLFLELGFEVLVMANLKDKEWVENMLDDLPALIGVPKSRFFMRSCDQLPRRQVILVRFPSYEVSVIGETPDAG